MNLNIPSTDHESTLLTTIQLRDAAVRSFRQSIPLDLSGVTVDSLLATFQQFSNEYGAPPQSRPVDHASEEAIERQLHNATAIDALNRTYPLTYVAGQEEIHPRASGHCSPLLQYLIDTFIRDLLTAFMQLRFHSAGDVADRTFTSDAVGMQLVDVAFNVFHIVMSPAIKDDEVLSELVNEQMAGVGGLCAQLRIALERLIFIRWHADAGIEMPPHDRNNVSLLSLLNARTLYDTAVRWNNHMRTFRMQSSSRPLPLMLYEREYRCMFRPLRSPAQNSQLMLVQMSPRHRRSGATMPPLMSIPTPAPTPPLSMPKPSRSMARRANSYEQRMRARDKLKIHTARMKAMADATAEAAAKLLPSSSSSSSSSIPAPDCE